MAHLDMLLCINYWANLFHTFEVCGNRTWRPSISGRKCYQCATLTDSVSKIWCNYFATHSFAIIIIIWACERYEFESSWIQQGYRRQSRHGYSPHPSYLDKPRLASHHITSFLYICEQRLVVEINSQHFILLSHLWRYIPAQ